MKMNKRAMAKTVIGGIAGMAAGSAISLLLKQNIDPIKTSEKVATIVGGFFVGNWIADKVDEHVQRTCDDIFESIDTIKKMNNETDNIEIVNGPEVSE